MPACETTSSPLMAGLVCTAEYDEVGIKSVSAYALVPLFGILALIDGPRYSSSY